MELLDFKTTFDGILQTYVDQKVIQAKGLLGDKKLNQMVQYIERFIFSGGKRLRPYCARAVYLWLGGTQEKAMLHFSILFELFHSFALIHDDIMDQAEKRHNELSTHNYIMTLLGSSPKVSHTAESQAILLGDLLFSWTYEFLYQDHPFSPAVLKEARANIQQMIEEVIAWQMIDVHLSISSGTDIDMINKKNMYKTASYTFIRPMLTGAILAGASQEQKDLISELGLHLGLAFQMRDDLMDITGGDKTKSVFTDIQEAQQTHFTYYIMSNGTEEQKALLTSCLWQKLDEQKMGELKEMFESSGAIDHVKEEIKLHLEKANEIFATIPFTNDEARDSFSRMMKKMERY